MSNPLAIAAVTQGLLNLLTANIDSAQVSGAQVTAVPPDQGSGLPNPGVNIYLYQVTPNAAFRNADLPTRAADGSLINKPQAAIDLHYLITYYGDETYLEQQRLLGAVTLALHAYPVLQRSQVVPVEIAPAQFADSLLESQSDLVRFTPVAFTLEELSKMWSFLFKIDYVLSSAYRASVVLIDTGDSPAPPLPVLAYGLTVAATRTPTITSVAASPDPSAPITAQSTIVVTGTNLQAASGSATEVIISGVTVTPSAVSPTSVTLTLPAGLAAGAQTLQIVEPLALGSPPLLHPGTGPTSALSAFVLEPTIAPSSPPGGYAISVAGEPGSPPGSQVTVGIVPTVYAGQRAVLQLITAGDPTMTQLFDGGTLAADSATVSFPVPGLTSGDYVARVWIDGAQTAVVTDASGNPVAPAVTL